MRGRWQLSDPQPGYGLDSDKMWPGFADILAIIDYVPKANYLPRGKIEVSERRSLPPEAA
jgi:hypothetical protein